MITSAGERLIVKADKIPRATMGNMVLVKIDRFFDDGEQYETEGGLNLVLAGGEWAETSRMVRFGEVARVPSRLSFRSKLNPKGLEWVTDIEIEEGDTVYFSAMTSANAEMVVVGDYRYFLINYGDLILRKRKDDIRGLNGYCVVEKVVEDKINIDGLELSFQKDVLDKKRGVVRHIGSRNKSYSIGSNIDAKVDVGDEVIFSIEAWTALEDETFAEMDANLGYIQMSWISGKL